MHPHIDLHICELNDGFACEPTVQSLRMLCFKTIELILAHIIPYLYYCQERMMALYGFL